MKRLLREGMIYAQPLREFKKDIKHDRYDQWEGLHQVKHLKKPKLSLKVHENDNWKQLPVTELIVNNFLDVSYYHNYSMVAITEREVREHPQFPIPEGMKGFGDSYVLIKNPREFMNRLDKTIEMKGMIAERGLVSYYNLDEDQHDIGFFHKNRKHSYEREYRILIENTSPFATTLFLGSLEDISEIIDINDFSGFSFIWK